MMILMTYLRSSPRLIQVFQFLSSVSVLVSSTAIKALMIFDIDTTDYKEEVSGNLLKDNRTAYVAGYLLRKTFQKHERSSCETALVTDQLGYNRNYLIIFKSYESDKNFGSLLAPTASFIDYVIRFEKIFVKDFSTHTKSNGIRRNSPAAKSSYPI